MIGKQVMLVEMDNKLAADADGSYRSRICDQLHQHLAAIRQQLQAGLMPEDFARADKMKEAIAAAEAIVQTAWSRIHENGAC